MDNGLMFSKNRNDWETPPEVFNPLNEIFHFTVDCAASMENAKCPKFFGEGDTLNLLSTDSSFTNPPYSPKKLCISILKPIYTQSSILKIPAVFLVPARTETELWQDIIFKMDHQFFFRGRLTFLGAPAPAPFPSALGIMNASTDQINALQNTFRGVLR